MLQGKLVTDVSFFPSARGDTFVFAEDDDDQYEDTTLSPGRSADSQPLPAVRRQLKPTLQPNSDFRPQQPDTPLTMTKHPRPVDTVVKKPPVMQTTPTPQTVPPAQEVPSMTEPPQIDAAAETTTVAVTTATTEATTVVTTEAPTEAPDPDAVVCSGRPFDSFMQLKNGSIYAFRGERLAM